MNITPIPAVLPRDFYVYEHRRATDGKVFYVGKGQRDRAWFTSNRSNFWKRVARKHGVIVTIVLDCLHEWYAHELETELIIKYGRIDNGTGCLVNMTDGGEGISGFKKPPISENTRRKLSEAGKNRRTKQSTRELLRLKNTGRKHTEESLRKMSEWQKGRKLTVDHVRKLSEAKKGKPQSPELRAKINTTLRSDKMRAAASLRMKGKALTSETKAKLSAVFTGRKMPDYAVQKIRVANNCKPIKHDATGMVFETYKCAAKWLSANGHKKASSAYISAATRGKRRIAYGSTWSFVEKNPA